MDDNKASWECSVEISSNEPILGDRNVFQNADKFACAYSQLNAMEASYQQYAKMFYVISHDESFRSELAGRV